MTKQLEFDFDYLTRKWGFLFDLLDGGQMRLFEGLAIIIESQERQLMPEALR